MEAENQIDSIYDTTAEAKNTKNIITFYFVKHHRYEDIEIEKANLEIKEKNQVIDDYYKDLKRYREDKNNAEWELWKWTLHWYHLTSSIHHTRNDLFYVQNALNKKYTVNRAVMQSTRVTELIKQAYKRVETQSAKREAYLQADERASLTEEINNLRARKRDALKKMKYFEQCLEDIDNKISYVFQKMETAISERDRTKQLRHKSKELTDKLKACDYKNLAVTKDRAALAELSNSELEKFFSQWNGDKTFRNECNRRVLWSHDIRGLSKNPDEKSTVQENIHVREKA